MVSRSARTVVELRMPIGVKYERTEEDTLVYSTGPDMELFSRAYDEAEAIKAELGIDVAVI